MSIQVKTTRTGYKQFWADGKRLPSPSAICSRWKDSGGLIYWANQQGLEGNTLEDARQVATTPGSIVHEMIEADIRKRPFDRDRWAARMVTEGIDPAPIWRQVDTSWQAYREWCEQTNLKVIAAELTLVSEKHQFGGTLDAVTVGRRVQLADWKTGALYPDHLLQLGGYAVLWAENMPEQPLDGACLLSISKDHGTFTHASYGMNVLKVAMDQFLRLREAYEVDKQLKKMM